VKNRFEKAADFFRAAGGEEIAVLYHRAI